MEVVGFSILFHYFLLFMVRLKCTNFSDGCLSLVVTSVRGVATSEAGERGGGLLSKEVVIEVEGGSPTGSSGASWL